MSRWLEILPTPLVDLKVILRSRRHDTRGYFERIFEGDDALGGGGHIRAVNHSHTVKAGTVRGMHFQHAPCAETKFVSCLKGRVFDVAVDLRRGSPTFLRWHGEELSEENGRTLVIPEGFAHGVQALQDGCDLLYLHTARYSATHEGRLHPLDPIVNITWPLPVTSLSELDAAAPLLDGEFGGYSW